MKATSLIRTGLAGAALLVLASAGAHAQEFVLKLHQFLPAQAPVPAGVLVPWMQKIETESGGRIKFEHYPAMQLGGKPGELIDQVTEGVADVVWTLPGYTPGRFPRTEVIRNTTGSESFQDGLLRRESDVALYAGFDVEGFYTDDSPGGTGFPTGVWTSPHDELFGDYTARTSISASVPPPFVCVESEPCDDGLSCTTGDVCSGGICVGADICPGGQFCSDTT